jgi:hypothetical protein
MGVLADGCGVAAAALELLPVGVLAEGMLARGWWPQFVLIVSAAIMAISSANRSNYYCTQPALQLLEPAC